jgi:hypothetical protein
MNKLYFWLLTLFSMIQLQAQTVTIGTGTDVGNKLPVVPYFGYSFSEQIVLQSEIGAQGTITKIRFYSTGTSLASSSNNWTIYLGHTSKANFSSTSDWILSGQMTQVFSGNVTAPSTAGWMEIALTTPFEYNNVDNLVVAVDENATGYINNSSANYFRVTNNTTTFENRALYYQSDSTNPDPATFSLSGTRVNYINQMQLVMPIATDISATAITGIPTSNCSNASVPLSVTLRNEGEEPIDFSVTPATVTLEITGASTQTLTGTLSTGTLAPAATVDVTMSSPANFTAGGVHQLSATVALTGDGGVMNNTVTASKNIDAAVGVPYAEGFSSTGTPAAWDITGWTIGANHGVTGNGIYKNLYGSAPSGQFTSGPVGIIGANHELKFDYRILNWATSYPGTQVPPTQNWGNFVVQVSNDCGVTFQTLGTVNNTNHTATDQSFKSKAYNLAAYEGQSIMFRIVATWNAGDYYLDFDNFSIDVAPSCIAPDDLIATDITSDGASLTWTGSGNFELQYGLSGFTLGTGTTVVAAGTNTLTLNDLIAEQPYQAYVRTDCGDEYSSWAGPVTFTPTNTVAYSGTLSTLYGSGVTTTTPSTCAGVMTINVPAGKRIASLTTEYVIEASSSNNAWRSEQRSYIYSPTLEAGESAVVSGEGGTGVMTYNRSLAFAVQKTGDIVFELRAFRTYGGSGCGDTYQKVLSWKLIPIFEDIPSCQDPGNVTASAVTADSAVISWNCVDCEGTFDVDYGIGAHEPGTGTILTDMTSGFTLESLVSNSNYVVYVRQNCGDETSPWSPAATFTTPKSCADLGAGTVMISNLPYFANGHTTCGNGNNVTGTDLGVLAGSANYFQGEDKTYIFTAEFSGPHNVTITTGADQDAGIALYQGCPFEAGSTVVGFAQSVSGLTRVINANLTAGETYYLVVDNYPSPDCITSYNVEITRIVCTAPTALASSGVTANSVNLNWNCVDCTGTFEIEYAVGSHTAGTGTIVSNVTPGFTLEGLNSNSTYYVYVRQDCGEDGYSSWSSAINFTTPRSCPTDLGPGSVIIDSLPYAVSTSNCGAGNNVTSGNVAVIAGSSNYYGGEDKTYIFTPAVNGVYEILLTTATDDDAGIVLYEGCPFTSGTTVVGFAQASTGLTRTLTPELTAGVTYYLVVDNWTSPACISSYTLTITPPSVPVITGLSTTSVCEGGSLTITGSGFLGLTAADVAIGGTPVTSITSLTATSMTVVVGNTSGVVSATNAIGTGSSEESVNVNLAPVISAQPEAAAVCAADTISLSVSATGAATYQWRRNGVALVNGGNIAGANTATLQIANATSANAGAYDLVLTSADGCAATSSAANVSVNALPIAEGAIVCQGGSGELNALPTCIGVASGLVMNYPNIVSGGPTYSRASTGTTYSSSSTVSYVVKSFQVTTTGTYTLNGCGSGDTHMQLYVDNFNPATPSVNFVEANDDGNTDAGCSSDPRITRTFTAGVNYYLVYTPFSGTGAVTGITVTAIPPAGGALLFEQNVSVNWYASATGGESIGSGNTFNPVGVAGSGLADTNTPGTYTFYAACASATDCRTAVTFIIEPSAVYYADADGDGYGNAEVTSVACSQPAGYVTNDSDCNDADGTIYRSGELYVDADNDGYTSGETQIVCYGESIPAGFVAAMTSIDCNDEVAAINPGAVDIPYNGIDDNCDGIIDEGSQVFSRVQPSQCGTTLTSLGSLVGLVSVPAATGYRIEITNTTTNAVQTIERGVSNFSFTSLPVYDYATTYSIRVMVQRNGIWLNYYGESCLVATPAITAPGGAAQVNPSQCGIELATINTLIATTSLPGVAQYRFRVTDLTDTDGPYTVQILDRPLQWFNLKMLDRYNYGTTYSIEVAVRTNGSSNFTGFGAPCLVYTPAVPLINQCDQVIATASTNISTKSLLNVTQYRFVLTSFADFSVTTVDRPLHYFRFSDVPDYAPGVEYGVQVAVMTTGEWSPLTDGCVIVAPGGARDSAKESAIAFDAVAYPNPFADTFNIELTTSAEADVNVKVYDMTGRMLEQKVVPATDMQTLQVGERFPAGVYNVIVTQGDKAKTLRVIKR